jgi:hypothetical protein
VGFNTLKDIYSSIRTLQPDSKTTITWQNISGRKEYEAHFWGGASITKKLKTNASIGYTYNEYSYYDRTANRFRNGGSLNTSLNGNYVFNPLFNTTASFTYNRFANPQGSVRNTLSMNIGAQHKFLKKNITLSLNIVDPFSEQHNYNLIYGKGYIYESESKTKSRNVRIALAYNLKKAPKKKPVKKKVASGVN